MVRKTSRSNRIWRLRVFIFATRSIVRKRAVFCHGQRDLPRLLVGGYGAHDGPSWAGMQSGGFHL